MTRILPIGIQPPQTTDGSYKNGGTVRNQTSVRQLGFTIMELLLVMAIIAVLSSIAMPALKGFATTRRLKASAYTLRDLLTFARDMAITERIPYLVVIDLDRELYWLASSETFNPRDPLTSIVEAENSTVITAQAGTLQRQGAAATASGQQALSRTSDILGIPQTLEQNVTFASMVTNHNGRTAQIEDGIEYVYFSPTGTSEETLIYLRNQQNQMMSITVELANGRVHVRQLTPEDIELLGFRAETRE